MLTEVQPFLSDDPFCFCVWNLSHLNRGMVTPQRETRLTTSTALADWDFTSRGSHSVADYTKEQKIYVYILSNTCLLGNWMIKQQQKK